MGAIKDGALHTTHHVSGNHMAFFFWICRGNRPFVHHQIHHLSSPKFRVVGCVCIPLMLHLCLPRVAGGRLLCNKEATRQLYR